MPKSQLSYNLQGWTKKSAKDWTKPPFWSMGKSGMGLHVLKHLRSQSNSFFICFVTYKHTTKIKHKTINKHKTKQVLKNANLLHTEKFLKYLSCHFNRFNHWKINPKLFKFNHRLILILVYPIFADAQVVGEGA